MEYAVLIINSKKEFGGVYAPCPSLRQAERLIKQDVEEYRPSESESEGYVVVSSSGQIRKYNGEGEFLYEHFNRLVIRE